MTRTPRRPVGRITFRTRNHATALLIAGGLVVLAGCGSNNSGSSDKDPSTTTSAPRPGTSSADPEIAARQDLLSTYRRYWDEKAVAYSKASMAGTDLATYAKGDALGLAQSDLKNLKTMGQVTEGKPLIHPQVTRLDLQKEVPLAQISDCVDVSAWKILNAKTRSEVALPKDRRTKYVSKVTAEKWGKQWVILEIKPENRAC
ncbi:hypothetical protein [Streptomyces sp. CoT10]|uniref:hypothetical protein n=1 Tax=Streptomyces sp. CoT10 TaxID=2875762 RepID=UPI001CD73C0A|nr:hypothetical protein [Streptomyces sp. CoT10]